MNHFKTLPDRSGGGIKGYHRGQTFKIQLYFNTPRNERRSFLGVVFVFDYQRSLSVDNQRQQLYLNEIASLFVYAQKYMAHLNIFGTTIFSIFKKILVPYNLYFTSL